MENCWKYINETDAEIKGIFLYDVDLFCIFIVVNQTLENMRNSNFIVKCYEKQELAQMYFPDVSVRVSVNKLRRWMRKCRPLMNEILSTDFHPNAKAFSVREVRLIVYYMGEPGDL